MAAETLKLEPIVIHRETSEEKALSLLHQARLLLKRDAEKTGLNHQIQKYAYTIPFSAVTDIIKKEKLVSCNLLSENETPKDDLALTLCHFEPNFTWIKLAVDVNPDQTCFSLLTLNDGGTPYIYSFKKPLTDNQPKYQVKPATYEELQLADSLLREAALTKQVCLSPLSA